MTRKSIYGNLLGSILFMIIISGFYWIGRSQGFKRGYQIATLDSYIYKIELEHVVVTGYVSGWYDGFQRGETSKRSYFVDDIERDSLKQKDSTFFHDYLKLNKVFEYDTIK